jgi:hypothetical protein
MDAFFEVILVDLADAIRGAHSRSVKGELDCVQNCGLAGTIHSAEENDARLVGNRMRRAQVESMRSPVETEIVEMEFFKNHLILGRAS